MTESGSSGHSLWATIAAIKRSRAEASDRKLSGALGAMEAEPPTASNDVLHSCASMSSNVEESLESLRWKASASSRLSHGAPQQGQGQLLQLPQTMLPPSEEGAEQEVGNGEETGAAEVGRKVIQKLRRGPGAIHTGPPADYVCHKCNFPGHWIHDCSSRTNAASRQVLPADYVCHKCKVPGHWIQHCTLAPQSTRPSLIQQGHVHGSIPRLPKPPAAAPTPLHANVDAEAPPSDYVCHKCNLPGHWIHDCSSRRGGQTNAGLGQAPPADYVCRKCKVHGHWIQDCTAHVQAPPSYYVCHKCNVPGHWIDDCPGYSLPARPLHGDGNKRRRTTNATSEATEFDEDASG